MLAAEAVKIAPFPVRTGGAITHAESSAMVPEEEIVPPVKPVPAVIEVTVPTPPPAAHLRPSAQVESAVKTKPSAPGDRATGVLAPVPVIKEPLLVMQDFGIAATAKSYTVLRAKEVAAVAEELLVTESERRTAPQLVVVAALIETFGVAPGETTIGAEPVKEPPIVPLDAFVMRPWLSTVILAFV